MRAGIAVGINATPVTQHKNTLQRKTPGTALGQLIGLTKVLGCSHGKHVVVKMAESMRLGFACTCWWRPAWCPFFSLLEQEQLGRIGAHGSFASNPVVVM